MGCNWGHPYGFPTGARQFLYIQTLNAVTLADGAYLLLELSESEYIGTADDPLGYDRFAVADHEALLTYGASGVPVVDGAWFDTKQQFRWNLNLSQAQAATLKGIYDTQQLRIKKLRANYAVRLFDARLITQEVAPRTRASITGLESGYPSAPEGQVYSYAQYDVLLKRPDDPGELLGNSFVDDQSGTLEALELDQVPASEDVVFNALRIDGSGLSYWDNTEW